MWLEIRKGDGTSSRLEIIGKMTIGRDPSCSVPLDDDNASRMHAAIEINPAGKATITDLGSRNGTFVNGRRVEGSVDLKGNEEIKIGGTRLGLSTGAAAPTRPGTQDPTLSDMTAPEPAAQGVPSTVAEEVEKPSVEVRVAGQPPKRVPIEGRVTIGRDPTCTIVIDDVKASRTHAAIEIGAGGKLTITDLGSRNGTSVGGRKIQGSADLQGNEEIKIGDTTFGLTGVTATAAKAGGAAPTVAGTVTSGTAVGRGSAPSTVIDKAKGPSIEVRVPGQAPTRIPIKGRMVIGRDDACAIKLEDIKASRNHAVIDTEPDGRVVLKDLGSSNGTFVDERKLEGEHTLTGSEEVRIGSTILALRTGESMAGLHTRIEPDAAPPGSGTPPAKKGSKKGLLVGAGVAALVAIVVGVLFLTGVLPPGSKVVPTTVAAAPVSAGPITAEEVAKAAMPGTVMIETRAGATPLGSGTGWVVDAEKGLIVTNAHVTAGNRWTAYPNQDGLTGLPRTAKLVGVAPCDDIALLQVTDTSGLTSLQMGSESETALGEQVVALGYPLAIEQNDPLSITDGVVSTAPGKEELPVSWAYWWPLPDLFRHTASINPGNSGGPLVNMQGEVVGMNSRSQTMNEKDWPTADGNYAIGIDRIKEVLATLEQGQSLGSFGIDYFMADSPLQWDPGTVVPGSDAALYGLNRFPGQILAIDGKPIRSQRDYCELVGSKTRGEQVTVRWGNLLTGKVTEGSFHFS